MLFVCGLGFGLAIAPVNASMLVSVREQMHGLASALVVVARMIGMLVGISILTAVSLHVFYTTAATLPAPQIAVPVVAAQLPGLRAGRDRRDRHRAAHGVPRGGDLCRGRRGLRRAPPSRAADAAPPGARREQPASGRSSRRRSRSRTCSRRSLAAAAHARHRDLPRRRLRARPAARRGPPSKDIDLVTVGIDPMPLLAAVAHGSAGIRRSGSSGSAPRRSAGPASSSRASAPAPSATTPIRATPTCARGRSKRTSCGATSR